MKKLALILGVMILAFFAIGLYSYYNIDSDQIASHWNVDNEVDGYMGKFWGIFLIPIISLGLVFLFLFIPRIDPMKKNFKKFDKYYKSFIIVFMIFMLYVYVTTMFYNFGNEINIGNFILPGIGVLFFFIGIIMKKIEQNWFIGIRTPWTLSSKKSWKETHKMASILFMLLAPIMFLTILVPSKFAVWFILIPTLGISFFLIFYSWLIWKKESTR